MKILGEELGEIGRWYIALPPLLLIGFLIGLFFLAAAHYIFGHPHNDPGFFTRPFYDPDLWNAKAVLGGTSIANGGTSDRW